MSLTSIIDRENQPCIILELGCMQCGPVRMAIAKVEPSPEKLPCPYCEQDAEAKLLGIGSTRRILPYYDLAPNAKQLDRVQSFSANTRPLLAGQIVCMCEEPEIFHFAKISEVYTSRVHLSPSGVPSVSFQIGGTDTGALPHKSGAETLPWWCWPDELPAPVQSNAPAAPAAKPEKKPRRERKPKDPAAPKKRGGRRKQSVN